MPRKYTEYTEAPSRMKYAAGSSGLMRPYTSVSCPQCAKPFVDIVSEQLLTSKASRVKRHIESGHTWFSMRECPKEEEEGAAVDAVASVPTTVAPTTTPMDALTERIAEMQDKLTRMERTESECKELGETVGTLRLQLNDVQNELSRSRNDRSSLEARVADLEIKVDCYKALMCKVGDLHCLERPYDHDSFMGKLLPALELHDQHFHDELDELKQDRDAQMSEVERLRASIPSTAAENERLRGENRRLRAELKDVGKELADFKFHNPRLRSRADELQVENERLKKRQRPSDDLEPARMMDGLIKLARDGSSGVRTFLLSAVHDDKNTAANRELAGAIRGYLCKHVPAR
jgi:predicted nuclease with TOPRIM domain